MPFTFEKLSIPDLYLIKPVIFGDDRGYFQETYKRSDFKTAGIDVDFVQDNLSISGKGTLRGLHFQNPPNPQGKLVKCIRGRVYDVAVDIRKGSPKFGVCEGIELSEENGFMIYIPPGFAHGYLTLSEKAYVYYKTTGEYSPYNEKGIIWNDPEININWPLTSTPVISDKDSRLPTLRDIDINFEYIKS